jgi:hypothetical protein
LPNLSINGTSPQLADGIAGCLLNGLVASPSESGNETVEHWIAILTRLAEEQDRGQRREISRREAPPVDEPAREMRSPLPKLAVGPWTSLGGYFDYSLWSERERFLELDRAIAAGQDLHDGLADREREVA